MLKEIIKIFFDWKSCFNFRAWVYLKDSQYIFRFVSPEKWTNIISQVFCAISNCQTWMFAERSLSNWLVYELLHWSGCYVPKLTDPEKFLLIHMRTLSSIWYLLEAFWSSIGSTLTGVATGWAIPQITAALDVKAWCNKVHYFINL